MRIQVGGFWRKFLSLLPQRAKTVGVVQTVNADGSYTVQLLGGQSAKVSGQGGYNPGDRVFVVDQSIDSRAPALPFEEIEV